jgi:flagellar biosynthesis GTPase FlhF
MKSQETLSKIMELLNLQDEVKLESMKLENGTTIEAEAFEANQEVFIVTEDERIALPVGEYTLEDGRILVVAEEGVIAEMRDGGEEEAPAEEPAQETEEVEANEEEEKEMSYATKEELSAAVEEMKAMIEEIKAMMSPKEEEMAEEVKEEVKEVEMSTDEPAAKPIKHSPDTKPVDMHQFSKGAKGDTLSRIFNKLG